MLFSCTHCDIDHFKYFVHNSLTISLTFDDSVETYLISSTICALMQLRITIMFANAHMW